MRAARGSVGIGVGIDILNVQKIWGTMSEFFNEYKGRKNANIVLVNKRD
jgi:hypothetical protein